MKRILIIAAVILIFGSVNAQIADVKAEKGVVKVYHEGDNYPSYSLSIDRDCELSGFNSKYVVITCPGSVRIYKDKDYSCSNTIPLDAGFYVKNVTSSAVLIKSPGSTRYYDFKGNFIKTTAD